MRMRRLAGRYAIFPFQRSYPDFYSFVEGEFYWHLLIANKQLHGRAGMRIGDWKITFVPPPFGPGQWQLFNIKDDPGEVFDAKNNEPGKYKELCGAWDKYLEANGVVWGAPMPLETIDGDGLADIIDNSTGWMQPIKDN